MFQIYKIDKLSQEVALYSEIPLGQHLDDLTEHKMGMLLEMLLGMVLEMLLEMLSALDKHQTNNLKWPYNHSSMCKMFHYQTELL
jgi:hypothetical protein